MSYRGRPLPWKLREAIRRRVGDGESRRSVADEFGLARNTVNRYAKNLRQV